MTSLDDQFRDRVIDARIARLATTRPDGAPHVVPVTFAFDPHRERLVTAVDHKPKSTTDLQRLTNIEANPTVSVVVDHYEDDWSRLWWARADGIAAVHRQGEEREAAVDRLVGRYVQYRERRPDGPAIVVSVQRWSTWSA